MPQQKKIVSANDLLSQVITGLRTAAVRPNVLGYVPHEKQAKFHKSSAKGRLYIGGNRSGKTTGGVVEGIWRLTGKHPTAKPPFIATPERPIRGRVVGVDFLNGIEKIILPEYARWTPASELRGGSWESAWSARLKTLYFENGSTVEFMSYDQDIDKFAGTSRDFIHYDEEPPEDVWKECNARLIDTGGPWWMTMTPVEGMTWIYDKIYLPGTEGTAKHIFVIEAHMSENPHISQTEIDLYLGGLDKDERRARGEGRFVQMGGLVFKSFNPNVHVVYPDSPEYLTMGELKSKRWKWYNSLDHGFNNPTAVLWHAVNRDNRVITFAEHYRAETTVKEHATFIHRINNANGRVPDLYVCDPALGQRNGVTGTSVQFEYNQAGLAYMLGNNDVKLGIDRMNDYLRYEPDISPPHWYIYGSECPNLVREMARLRWKRFVSKKTASDNNKKEDIHKKDDHAPDSARYFFTMLPDLTPQDAALSPEKDWRNQFGNVPTGYGIEVPRYDENLSKAPQSTEWTVIDEYMGGLI